MHSLSPWYNTRRSHSGRIQPLPLSVLRVDLHMRHGGRQSCWLPPFMMKSANCAELSGSESDSVLSKTRIGGSREGIDSNDKNQLSQRKKAPTKLLIDGTVLRAHSNCWKPGEARSEFPQLKSLEAHVKHLATVVEVNGVRTSASTQHLPSRDVSSQAFPNFKCFPPLHN